MMLLGLFGDYCLLGIEEVIRSDFRGYCCEKDLWKAQ